MYTNLDTQFSVHSQILKGQGRNQECCHLVEVLKIQPFVWNEKDQTDGRVRRRCFPHSKALLSPALFSSRSSTTSLVQMLRFYMWLEHFHSLLDTLLLMDNGRGWVLSGCQTLRLVCSKQRLRRVWLAAVLMGFQASHIGHVVVSEMCRNYM